MFILANLIQSIAQIFDVALTIFYWLILARAIISWVSPDPGNTIVQFLYKTTEPVLYHIRRFLPFDFRFGLDISPIIAFLAIMFLKSFLVQTLLDLGLRMKM
ncbi:MAG: YggT family protein [Candidatus Omnitrophota bacterium]